ncbi:Gfo/Idh/MocA family oxidoreductase [Desulfobacca acetoxidans]|uniref:Oxidoreductase domain protein n=1 Tax=Desulfobacca acetoxidans (strain ATCC 700848 / DSM 11109 / ASRB2) TaxID=880072 RepID=F2NJH7_DESAR|nr:Gfo/Idh/MocA family oxidoreductase [Desulfobacca acetoxidans]AEB09489.1 oxidoreductase domain protein [Desulfobacca acetoxidans DSM 11109]
MKQVIQSYKNGKITLEDVPPPAVKAGGLLVHNVASLISAGTEKLMIEMGRKSLVGKARARPDLVRQAWAKAQKEGFVSVFKEAMNRLDEPVPLGYSAAGMVREVGAGVNGYQPGDRVAVMGAGFASHAELLWVPENLCVPIPAGVDFEAAAFGMLGCIALHGVREAGLTLGEKALVIGLGLLGLLTVQLLASQGCRVIGVDLDRRRCDLARELGADLALVPGQENVEEAVANCTGGLGADAVLIVSAGQDNRPILLAEAVARERARLVLVGVADLSLTRKTFWEKELRFSVSRASGPGSLAPLYEAKGFDYPVGYVRWTERRNLSAFLDLIAQGKMKLERLITHRFDINNALQAYDLILKNQEPYIGVLLTYPEPDQPGAVGKPAPVGTPFLSTSFALPSRRSLGLIGGGMFTRNILLPALKKLPGLELARAATTTGVSAHQIAKKYGFAQASTNYREILQDSAIGSVLITTRHNSHAELVLEALAAGKNVFVEKPLCLTEEDLHRIISAYDGARLLMVGFNRRYSPMAMNLKAALANRTTPLVMTFRVNAGYIPLDQWVHDPQVGGGRLLGEVCHFIDFLGYMADSPAVRVCAAAISGVMGRYIPEDNLTLTLNFQDGSLGTILYTAKGSKTFSRERFEVYCEDSVGVIEDFRQIHIIQGGRRQTVRKLSMDMGYANELRAFFLDHWEPAAAARLFSSYANSTQATLKALESLRTRQPVPIS